MRESESAIAKDTGEIHHARLGPSGLVVAGCSIIRHAELIKRRLDRFDRGTVAILGEVASDDNKLDGWIKIDICNRALEILHRTRIGGGDMRVGE